VNLTNDNYFSPEAMREYWSVSQFKSFNKCEECGLAELNGDYERPETDALLIGSYVDAYFSGELKEFIDKNGSKMVKKDGRTLLAKFEQANIMIKRVEADPLMREFLKGEKQVIRTGELFGVPWKIKIDVLNEKRIVDVKAVKDFEDVYDPAYGSKRSWIEYWGYDIQGAIYQKIEQISSGRSEPLPFYLEAVTKEKVGSVPEPDIKIVQIPQHILDAALKLVEAKIDRFDLIKQGEVDPIRCGRCSWCKRTKILRAPEIYEIREA
jgi:hypothetical protein